MQKSDFILAIFLGALVLGKKWMVVVGLIIVINRHGGWIVARWCIWKKIILFICFEELG